MRLHTPPEVQSDPRAGRAWPDAATFREAIQTPSLVLPSEELQRAQVVSDRRGLPLAYSGRFAVVFRLRTADGDWALRCFTQVGHADERRERCRAIATQVADLGSCFVPFRYEEHGIRIGQAWYPTVALRWAEGETLGRFVENNLHNPRALADLAHALTRLIWHLEQVGVAHGDWQHDNLLVSGGGTQLTLVDYDGMFVPELAGRSSPELGHPNYQHPGRTSGDYNVGLDRFAHLVMQTALVALCRAPSLWDAFNDGECLLFKKSDFADPEPSPVFRTLRVAARADPLLCSQLDALQAACASVPGGALLSAHPPMFLPPSFRRALPTNGAQPDVFLSPMAAAVSAPVRVESVVDWTARLWESGYLQREWQHKWVTRLSLAGITGASLYAALVSADLWCLAAGGVCGAAVAAYSYATWPQRKLYAALQQSLEDTQRRLEWHGRRLEILRRFVSSSANQTTDRAKQAQLEQEQARLHDEEKRLQRQCTLFPITTWDTFLALIFSPD